VPPLWAHTYGSQKLTASLDVQNRRPQIRQPTHARLPPRLRHHFPRTRHKRLLPRFRTNHGAASCEFSDKIWQLYDAKAVCAGVCGSWGEAGDGKHIWNRGGCRVYHCVGQDDLVNGKRLTWRVDMWRSRWIRLKPGKIILAMYTKGEESANGGLACNRSTQEGSTKTALHVRPESSKTKASSPSGQERCRGWHDWYSVEVLYLRCM